MPLCAGTASLSYVSQVSAVWIPHSICAETPHTLILHSANAEGINPLKLSLPDILLALRRLSVSYFRGHVTSASIELCPPGFLVICSLQDCVSLCMLLAVPLVS